MNLIELLGYKRPDWQKDAACHEHPDVNFFPERGESSAPAKAICAMCLVANECRQYAIDNGIKDGIWGHQSGRDRRTARREANADRPPLAKVAACGTDSGYQRHWRLKEPVCEQCREAHRVAIAAYKARRRGAA